MNALVCVGTYATRHEVEMARGILEAGGIDPQIAADDCGGLRPHVALGTGGVRLLVRRGQLAGAKRLLAPRQP